MVAVVVGGGMDERVAESAEAIWVVRLHAWSVMVRVGLSVMMSLLVELGRESSALTSLTEVNVEIICLLRRPREISWSKV